MKNGNNADDTAQRNFKNRMSLQGHATNDGDMYIWEPRNFSFCNKL